MPPMCYTLAAMKSIIPVLAVALLVPSAAHAWGRKKDKKKGKDAPAAAASMKAGVHQKCLQQRAEENFPDAWVALGQLDQVRGFHREAAEKYAKAVALGADPAKVQVELTMVGDVIWIQNDACKVPVPAAPAGETVSAITNAIEPVYPKSIWDSTRAEGNAFAKAWVDQTGKVTRVEIVDASSALPQIQRVRDPNEEAAERLLSRVQFALTTIETLRAHSFEGALAGKVHAQKFAFKVPDTESRLPGQGIDTPATGDISPGTGLGSSGK